MQKLPENHHQLLTKTEQKVFNTIGEGIISNITLGQQLCLSPHTVKNHKENIKEKLTISSCQELLRLAVESKLNS